MFIFGITAGSQPIDGDGYGGHEDSGGDAAAEVAGEGEEGASTSKSEEGEIEAGIEGPVEVGGNAGVDLFVHVDFILVHLPNFLFLFEDLEGQ